MDQFEKKIIWVKMRVNEAEQQAIKELSRQAGCRTISEYCRKVLLKKPKVVHDKNESLKDFLNEMLALKRTLHGISDAMGQAAEQLSSPAQSPEIRRWGQIQEQDQQQFQKQITTIFETADKIYKQWSHE